jgi:hypothetical protein
MNKNIENNCRNRTKCTKCGLIVHFVHGTRPSPKKNNFYFNQYILSNCRNHTIPTIRTTYTINTNHTIRGNNNE